MDFNENNININMEDNEDDRELLYNEESGFHDGRERIFNDNATESQIFEIEFKIKDNQYKNVIL